MKLSKFNLPNSLKYSLNQDEKYFIGFIANEGFLSFGYGYNDCHCSDTIESTQRLKNAIRRFISTDYTISFPSYISLHTDVAWLKGSCPFNDMFLIFTYNASTQTVQLVYTATSLESYQEWVEANK